MPISWQIRDGLIWVESTGESGVDDRRSVIEAVLKDPAHRPGMGLIYDVRRRTGVPDAGEIQLAIAYLASRGQAIGRARWAVVVDNAAGFGMGRMAGALLESGAATRASGSMITAGSFGIWPRRRPGCARQTEA